MLHVRSNVRIFFKTNIYERKHLTMSTISRPLAAAKGGDCVVVEAMAGTIEGAAGTRGPVDLFIIGGGINGCGIARDAAGRGLSVRLAEQGDLAQATSSSSTKLFHGGLRYLEFFEFRLVREALQERETLLKMMPHISWPMRFVLPYHADMRFESETPTSKLLSLFMPWMKGRRPAWLIRLGLFLYDNLGGRDLLPGTRTLDLTRDPAGKPLREKFAKAYEYSDCWVQDSRLVVLTPAMRRRAAPISGLGPR